MLITALLSTIGLFIVGICLLRPASGIKVVVITALIATGSASYFLPQVYKIAWVVSAGGFSLLVPALLTSLTDRIRPNTGILVAMSVFGFLAFMSIASNFQYPGEILAAARNNFQFWSIPVLAYCGLIGERDSKVLIRLIFWAAVLQIPVSIFQYFYVVEWSARFAGGDSVVGTFGGDPEGGGDSGAQTTYLVIVWCAIMSLYLGGVIKGLRYAVASFAILLPAFLNETKIIFVYLPIAAVLLVRSSLRRYPIRTVVIFGLTSLVVVGVLFFYFTSLQHGDRLYKADTIEEYVERQVMSQSGLLLEHSSGLTRLGSIIYWWQQHNLSKDPLPFLFGHGLGASKTGGIFRGHLYEQRQYALLHLDQTGLSSFLWDVGIFGTVSYLSIFSIAMISAIRLRRNSSLDTQQRALLLGVLIALAIFLLGNLYDDYLVRNQALNVFSMCCLAYVIFIQRIVKQSTKSLQGANKLATIHTGKVPTLNKREVSRK